jgi:hypothetical protein
MADTTATKKTTSKKAPAKKAAKKATKKTAPAKKTTKKTAAAKTEPSRQRKSESPVSNGARLAREAQETVLSLTGKVPESVTALERSDDGWRVAVEVLELERIPNTTDVMATYEVRLDDEGELRGYRRVHRYLRGSPGDE